MKRTVVMFCMILFPAVSGLAQSVDRGKGQGAIVINQDAVLYEDSEGADATTMSPLGDSVGGITTIIGRTPESYYFEEEDGRVHVLALLKNGQVVQGWMNPADLSPYFTYECGCGLEGALCSPHARKSITRFKWNACFEEARQAKLAELQTGSTPPVPSSGSSESAETRLQKLNDLYKKGLISKDDYEKKKAEILKSM
jgi:hypothetical protein